MSFLKITDPKKRDFIVNEFLKTKLLKNLNMHLLGMNILRFIKIRLKL